MKRFKKILYVLNEAIAGPLPSLTRAISLAKNNQADLTVLYVLPKLSLSSYPNETGMNDKELKANILDREAESLRNVILSFEKETDIKVEFRVGKKYIESIHCVLENEFDLVVKEAEKISWLDRFVGSDDMHLLRKCPCPVWLMKKDEKINYGQIMAAVDLGAESDATCNGELNEMIMDLASSLSLSDFASQHVVNVYDVPEEGFISLWAEQPEKVEQDLFEAEHRLRDKKMNALFNGLKSRMGADSYQYLSPIPHIVRGLPERELPKVAKDVKADLVIMGTVARTGIAGVVIGNTAEAVLSQLQCSILAIKPKGFVSPLS